MAAKKRIEELIKMNCKSLLLTLVVAHLLSGVYCASPIYDNYSGDEESSDSKSVSENSLKSHQANNSVLTDIIPEQSEEVGSGTNPDTESENSGLGSGSSSGEADQESGDNQEPDMEQSGSGDDSSKSKSKLILLIWKKQFKNGSEIDATAEEMQKLSAYVSSHSDSSHDCFISKGSGDRGYDGPVFSIDKPVYQTLPPHRRPPLYEFDKPVDDVREYPGYATGQLDNGCTAFLVGPYHALTLVECAIRWNNPVNFLRGRDRKNYLQLMEWEYVYIPQKRYFYHNIWITYRYAWNSWGLIVFKRDKPSPVWLPISYCSLKVFSFADKVRAFGYYYQSINRFSHDDEINSMFYTDCSISSYDELECSHQFMRYGGPVVPVKSSNHLSYDIKNMKNPPVVGIKSYANGGAISFNSEIFWSLVYLLRESGHNSFCEKWERTENKL